MARPTKKSLDEASRTCGYKYSKKLSPDILELIQAHALTLDQLHGRVEMSEAEAFYREIVEKRLFGGGDDFLDDGDLAAIAMIEAKFSELRGEWDSENRGQVKQFKGVYPEPEWIDWRGGECPVAENAVCEFAFRSGRAYKMQNANTLRWNHTKDGCGDIVKYRVWPKGHPSN